MRSRSVLLGLLIAVFSSYATAHNKVVVVPLGGGEFKPLKNIVTVAAENGDFTDIQAAIDSINDASATNPYLVAIGPGTFNVSSRITTKEHVHISGSGKDATIIEGSISSSSFFAASIINVINSNVRLSDLSVQNTSTSGTHIMGLSLYQPGSTLENITVENMAIRVGGSPSNSSRGVYVEGATTVLKNLDVFVSGTLSNYGIRTYSGSTKLIDSNVTVESGSSTNRAVYSRSSAETVIDHSELTAEGTNADALYGPATVRYSTLSGANDAIGQNTNVEVFWSTLIGSIADTSGSNVKCYFSVNETGPLTNGPCVLSVL